MRGMYWSMENIERMQSRFQAMWPHLDEKGRRLWAASEAKAHGRGGIKLLHEISGISRSVIITGMKELSGELPFQDGRIRKAGAGRKSIKEKDQDLLNALKNLVESDTIGLGAHSNLA